MKTPTKFQEKPSCLLSPKWCIFEITKMGMAIFVIIEFLAIKFKIFLPMTTINFKERYKMILRKNNITVEEMKEFNNAIKAFVMMHPNWKENNHFNRKEKELAS
ncbi:MAG: hypothetical protein AUK33_07275 [Flavobacteriaceae bacterium CG2_30_34_30]|nr:MAG: hypothetical protein AUK33_07275 [Flavobacteriaceae bacterium CG2_30_34_30]PIQ17527.1 MAG: hypothetical protein COW66_11300 [Flavobacteriaceae bacterium CG18_big_fil_WC_8_21_14_2_50_34_36]PIV48435.1 MAG: hypothetical protein COS19_13820 [Flavobacteriaceae bacterium CG02_land_8_20_14_3_00_34_13]PIZ08178.1 MAG: hypothetical protein COY56_05250 [Flavobacteriaceae bacterium CG_4_10_14_0_8_um_filter_34_31]PJC07160.1 MAG: hypothetical protein CO068_07525 [Flavobacteriaceae bacterium CG_4_9_14